jgi:hypothetical protein
MQRSANPGAARAVVRTSSRLLLLLVLFGLFFGACIIEEREFDKQARDCNDYCTLVEDKCTNNYKVYNRRDDCMAVCALMDTGDVLGRSERNTLACRLERLHTEDEPDIVCPEVGPGGNGTCGDDCDALCTLRQQVCTDIEGQETQRDLRNKDTCLQQCRLLQDEPSLDASTRDLVGDTLQCRLVHISEAAISKTLATTHCVHTQPVPEPGEGIKAPCSDPEVLDQGLACEKYCRLVMGACTNELQVYDSAEQCEEVCALLEPGLKGDIELNTVRCRRYHSYAAVTNPEEHCTHAGPTGDGHCGTENCSAYCRIAKQGCPTQFAVVYGGTAAAGDLGSCPTDCPTLNGADRDGFHQPDARYTVSNVPVGNNLMCRTYHAVKALAVPNDPVECPNALGSPLSTCF